MSCRGTWHPSSKNQSCLDPGVRETWRQKCNRSWRWISRSAAAYNMQKAAFMPCTHLPGTKNMSVVSLPPTTAPVKCLTVPKWFRITQRWEFWGLYLYLNWCNKSTIPNLGAYLSHIPPEKMLPWLFSTQLLILPLCRQRVFFQRSSDKLLNIQYLTLWTYICYVS